MLLNKLMYWTFSLDYQLSFILISTDVRNSSDFRFEGLSVSKNISYLLILL